MSELDSCVIAVLGGTGPQGRGLARRFAIAGLKVVVGSRTVARAVSTASDIAEATDGVVSGASNADAAAQGEIVVVAVPWEGHAETLVALRPALEGKIVVDCVNPVGFDKQGPYALNVPEGSAAQQAEALLPGSRVVAAFHHVSAVLLESPEIETLDTDVMVLGDDRDATDVVRQLVARIPGMRGIYAGRLRNAHQIEALTCNLISINRRYKAHAGVRVTDVQARGKSRGTLLIRSAPALWHTGERTPGLAADGYPNSSPRRRIPSSDKEYAEGANRGNRL